MTTAPSPGAGPLRVSIEGINGVGKTSAARAVTAMLGARCLLLDELTDTGGASLHGRVIAALTEGSDPFLRTGQPVTETLALLALQVGKTERLARRDLTGVDVIIEDRGMDTVAVYQAAILCSQHPETPPEMAARHVLASARRWWRIPSATIQLSGDLAECARRFTGRIGRPLTPVELQLFEQIDTLYRAAAAVDPDRFIVLEVTGMSAQETAGALGQIVATLMDRRATHAA
jgi:dTMP kinase